MVSSGMRDGEGIWKHEPFEIEVAGPLFNACLRVEEVTGLLKDREGQKQKQ